MPTALVSTPDNAQGPPLPRAGPPSAPKDLDLPPVESFPRPVPPESRPGPAVSALSPLVDPPQYAPLPVPVPVPVPAALGVPAQDAVVAVAAQDERPPFGPRPVPRPIPPAVAAVQDNEPSEEEDSLTIVTLVVRETERETQRETERERATLLYNQPDGDVNDVEFLRAEKLFLATPQSEVFAAPLFDTLRAVRESCAADYLSLCAPFEDNQDNEDDMVAGGAAPLQDDDALSHLEELLGQWLPLRRLAATAEGEGDAQSEREGGGAVARALSVARALYAGRAPLVPEPPSQRPLTVAPRTTAALTAKREKHAAEKRERHAAALRSSRALRSRERDGEREKGKNTEREKERGRKDKDDHHKERERHGERDRESPPRGPHRERHGEREREKDELYYGALSFGAPGDACLAAHRVSLSAPLSHRCTAAVDALGALRERYAAQTMQPPPPSGCFGLAALPIAAALLALLGALLFVRAKGARRAHERERDTQALLRGLASDDELRDAVQRKLSLAVPAPHDAPHWHGPHGPHGPHRGHSLFGAALALLLAALATLCVAASSLVLTGAIARAVGLDGEGEGEGAPGAVAAIALSLMCLQALLISRAARCLGAHCSGEREGEREASAPPAPPSPPSLSPSPPAPPAGGAALWQWARLSLAVPRALPQWQWRRAHRSVPLGEGGGEYAALAGDELDASAHSALSQHPLPSRSFARAQSERGGERELVVIGAPYAPLSHGSVVAAVPVNAVAFV